MRKNQIRSLNNKLWGVSGRNGKRTIRRGLTSGSLKPFINTAGIFWVCLGSHLHFILVKEPTARSSFRDCCQRGK